MIRRSLPVLSMVMLLLMAHRLPFHPQQLGA